MRFGEREHAIGGELARAMRVELDVRRAGGGGSIAAAGASAAAVLAGLCRRGRGPLARPLARHDARAPARRWRLLWLLVGPGILAMLGENDGPSMIAYASDGAEYGLGFFVPFIL